MTDYFRNDDELRDLVMSFEACSFHPSEFRHHQHLAVALWYVWHLSSEAAVDRITNGIRRLAETYGKTGYHEMTSLFWVRMVSDFATKADRTQSLATIENQLIGQFENKNLIFDYFSAGLVSSAEAKAKWVEPDLKRLPFAGH